MMCVYILFCAFVDVLIDTRFTTLYNNGAMCGTPQHLMALCNGALIVDSIVAGQHGRPSDKAVKFIQPVDVKMAPRLNFGTLKSERLYRSLSKPST